MSTATLLCHPFPFSSWLSIYFSFTTDSSTWLTLPYTQILLLSQKTLTSMEWWPIQHTDLLSLVLQLLTLQATSLPLTIPWAVLSPNHTIHQSLPHQQYGYFQFIDFIMPTLLFLTSLDFQSMTSPFSLKLRPQGPALRSISFQYTTFLWPLFLYQMLRVKLSTQMDETNCLPFLCLSWATIKHYSWKKYIFVRLATL